jgi:hypothetical protein
VVAVVDARLGTPSPASWSAQRRFPDFFLIGAPKCGTTSLYRYLEANEAIHLTKEKEPGFFCADLPFRAVTTEDSYLALFGEATAAPAVGEASPWYLYSRVAVPRILTLCPQARFVVVLRNPVEMALSLYHHHKRAGIEVEPSFEAAWRAQRPDHLADHPLDGRVIRNFPYADACSLGSQLQRLYRRVDRGRVLVVLLDDLAARPAPTVADVCRFLGVPVVLPDRFGAHNASRVNRSQLLTRIWYRATQRTPLYWSLKRAVNRAGLRPGRWVFDRVITRERSYPSPSPAFRALMRDRFAADVTLLAQLIGRPLEHWRA